MKRVIIVAFVAIAAVVVPRQLDAQQSQPGAGNAPYLLADIMSGTQWRHLKLAYAGKVKNWQLADYELGRMQQSFGDAAQFFPVFKSIPLAQLIKNESEPPLADLRKAIDAKSSVRQVDGRVQSLPSGRRRGLHRDPHSDIVAVQQSVVSAD